ncbi:MAG: hypothetical protein R2795_15785 [Saprospiraceae bacterium]
MLFERLRRRNTENEESLTRRIERAAEELTYENSFDEVLLNDDLAEALAAAEALALQFLDK